MKKKSRLLRWWYGTALAKRVHPEKYYQAKWCNEQGGQLEVVLSDGVRCDCLLPSYAVEVDFGKKWAEGLGQALEYGRQTGRRPGVLLILENPRDWAHVERLEAMSKHYGLRLKIWTVEAWK